MRFFNQSVNENYFRPCRFPLTRVFPSGIGIFVSAILRNPFAVRLEQIVAEALDIVQGKLRRRVGIKIRRHIDKLLFTRFRGFYRHILYVDIRSVERRAIVRAERRSKWDESPVCR